MALHADSTARVAGPLLAAYPALDEAKKEIIAHDQGPLLVIAGPGSGKTLSLVLRTVNLLLSDRAQLDIERVCALKLDDALLGAQKRKQVVDERWIAQSDLHGRKRAPGVAAAEPHLSL